ncbi:hypothetical protein Ddye_026027 [Dipteronia dyeriana]|uniref:Uncharacterized protein n=1 Tax=Dipteronia dyeriana TaxID=168575 RepID=A0AAD9TLZ5_9ROSI|nr:hypothetical protein Ddye_026027 [Dipteronia dyeriana]
MVLLMVHYDGQWEDGQFNPKSIFFLSVAPKDTLKTLAEKICNQFGLNCDEVDFMISTRIDDSVVEMIFDLDLQIFVSHNKENHKCYVSKQAYLLFFFLFTRFDFKATLHRLKDNFNDSAPTSSEHEPVAFDEPRRISDPGSWIPLFDDLPCPRFRADVGCE